jgi:putative PIN family toxin of toxin-antitoxin system
MKIIIDTNILISSALRGGKPKLAIALIIADSRFEWIASPEIVKEYKEVLSRPKFKLSSDSQAEWFELIDLAIKVIDVNITVDFPRDRKDAKFLACAIAFSADYLITGDQDFENIPDLAITKVVTVSQFVELMEDE